MGIQTSSPAEQLGGRLSEDIKQTALILEAQGIEVGNGTSASYPEDSPEFEKLVHSSVDITRRWYGAVLRATVLNVTGSITEVKTDSPNTHKVTKLPRIVGTIQEINADEGSIEVSVGQSEYLFHLHVAGLVGIAVGQDNRGSDGLKLEVLRFKHRRPISHIMQEPWAPIA